MLSANSAKGKASSKSAPSKGPLVRKVEVLASRTRGRPTTPAPVSAKPAKAAARSPDNESDGEDETAKAPPKQEKVKEAKVKEPPRKSAPKPAVPKQAKAPVDAPAPVQEKVKKGNKRAKLSDTELRAEADEPVKKGSEPGPAENAAEAAPPAVPKGKATKAPKAAEPEVQLPKAEAENAPAPAKKTKAKAAEKAAKAADSPPKSTRAADQRDSIVASPPPRPKKSSEKPSAVSREPSTTAPATEVRISVEQKQLKPAKAAASAGALSLLEPSKDHDMLRIQYETLRRQYDELERVAVVQAKESFDKFKEEAKKKEAAMDERIRRLNKEVTDLEGELKKKTAECSSLSTSTTKTVKALEEGNKALKAEADQARQDLVNALATATSASAAAGSPAVARSPSAATHQTRLYQELTGLVIVDSKEKETWDCALRTAGGELKFTLALTPSGKEYIYQPRFYSSLAASEAVELPPFLDGEIRFNRTELGKWYRKVLLWAYSK
ncbi:hypothetical protein DFJ74DRAFT_678073 [Hyaloraphidium curvatum]|nr:hypothetical protein DFJ74DRAFT_678073 [Hyaloraphidium curvatum]